MLHFFSCFFSATPNIFNDALCELIDVVQSPYSSYLLQYSTLQQTTLMEVLDSMTMVRFSSLLMFFGLVVGKSRIQVLLYLCDELIVIF